MRLTDVPRACLEGSGALARSAPRALLLAGVALGLAACSFLTCHERTQVYRYQQVVASPIRTDQDRSMDAARHPVEFLAFARVETGMRVLDVSAGAGYTSQLLALAVGDGGRVFAQSPKPGERLTERLVQHPQTNLTVVALPFENPVPPGEASFDLITIVLNYHDISYLPVDRARMNANLFAALKRGGHLVIIDHSARSGSGIADGKTLHRIDEAVVLSEEKAAGFELEAESDYLRNPADARDQASSGGTVVSDKFALRFVKP